MRPSVALCLVAIPLVALGLLTAACGPGPTLGPTQTSGSTTGGSSGGSPQTTAVPSTSSTTPAPTTGPGPTTDSGTGADTGSSEDGGGDETAATTGSCGFTCPPVQPPPNNPCAPPAEGCGAGEKCIPASLDGGENWARTACAPEPAAPAGLGEPCTRDGGFGVALDDCAAGLLCDAVDPRTHEGVCASLCTAFGSQVCPQGTLCIDPFEIGTGLCVAPCDPLGDDCRPSEACWPAGLSFGCFYAPSRDDPEGCELDVQCGAGWLCIPADDLVDCEHDACCADMCDVNEAGCGEHWCVSLEFPLAAHADVGYCED